MNFSGTFYLNAGGLFDFDLTLVAEAVLFIILALVVTFVFISPISKELDDRADFINYTLRNSTVFVSFASDTIENTVELLLRHINELNRQTLLTKEESNLRFEVELTNFSKENTNLLNELKGELSIKSISVFSSITTELLSLTDKFFIKKFQSAS